MPGINLISVNDSNNYLTTFTNIQSNMRYDHTYRSEVFLQNNHTILGYTGYDGYPIRSYEDDTYFAILEGMIYNVPTKEVDSFISNIVSQKRHSGILIDNIENFLLNSDGEFVIIIYDKLNEDLIIVNDALGRLPLYYTKGNQKFILSREVKFVTEFMTQVNFDKLAIAEYLLFGYPLGKRTLIKDIKRLEPGVLVEYNINSGSLRIKKVHTWNFEDKFSKGKGAREYADDLVELFRNATRCRAKSLPNFKNLVSLSGGLDSRAVAVALRDVDPELTAVTYLDYEGKAQNDVNVARELAHKLGVDWELIELEKRNFEDICRLIELKDGLNYAAMGFILDFFTKIKSKFGDKVVYYTGDGGDKALRSLKPLKRIKSMDELVSIIISRHASIFGMNEIKRFINTNRIKREIRNILLDYPEDGLNQKYVHFVVFERGYKWLFEGEDRNRFYFWSTSPYWSPIFFNYAMKIPDSYKEYLKLHRKFLEKLDKNCVRIRNAWGICGCLGLLLGPFSFYLIPRIEKIIFKYPFLRKLTEKAMFTRYNPNKSIRNYRQIRDLSYLNACAYLSNLKELLDNNLNEPEFFTLITIILYILHLRNAKRLGGPTG